CGLPFLAQWNTMVFYPFSLIYLLFPLSWSLGFFCLFHLWWAAFGMFILARSWTGHNFAAAVAGLSFIFSGVLLSCLKWPNNMAALGWMPWLVFYAERAVRGNLRAVATAALVGAAQMLAGAPEIIVLSWVITGILTLYVVFTQKAEQLPIVGKFLALVVLVAALCSVQLLPFLDLLSHSQREAGFHGSQWPMPPWGWANFFLPLFRMFPSYHDVHAQPGQYWISTYYVSISVWVLAVVAFSKVRTARVWLLAGTLVIVLWISLGERALLYKWLRATIPGLGMMRFPIKFVVLAAFILPLLGALGLAHLLSGRDKAQAKSIWIPTGIILAIIGSLILFSELNPFRYSRAFLTTWNGLWRMAFLSFGAALLGLLWKREGASRRIPALLFLALAVIDGLSHTTWQNPAVPKWVYSGAAIEMVPKPLLGHGRAMMSPEAADTIDHLKLDYPVEDVMASRISLYCNLNLLEHIPKIDGFYAIYPREMAEVQDLLYATTNLPPAALLDFLGVTQISADHSWDQWEHRPSALPLITSPPRLTEIKKGVSDLFGNSFNPREEALLEVPAEAIPSTGAAQIDRLDWKPEKITFQARSAGPATIVLSQTFYHNWAATIDGAPVPILRANHAFQALRFSSGTHTVVLEYIDQAFRLGSIISLVAAAAVIALIVLSRQNAK
ncbi:MAG TPA: YfhO family protein, partial [Verrucomicrobiae bacterium]|nr:YfhO family protein [Verrucomicrobiae bacterium]